MRSAKREEILDYQTYEAQRPQFQSEVFAVKAARRVHVGRCLTFLFENDVTVRYQVQEMMRAERIVKGKDIRHELETYNALLGGAGELGCTLLIEIDDPVERASKLREWLHLPEHIYLLLHEGSRVRPKFDEAQIGADRLSSVQYLKFPVGNAIPRAIGIDLPGIEEETQLTAEQVRALTADLNS